jgi:hypothetical protein
MENLDRQRLILIALELDYVDLLNFCKTNKIINKLIYQYPTFWINKLGKDFNFAFKGKPDNFRNPKDYYKLLHKYYPFDTQEKINEAFLAAVYDGYLDLARYILTNYNPKKEERLGGFQAFLLESVVKAIKEEHKNSADYLISLIDNTPKQSPWFSIVNAAAEKGYLDIVESFTPYFKNTFHDLWNRIIRSTIIGEQKHVIEYAIKNGARQLDINLGLFYAVKEDHDNLIPFFIEKGAKIDIATLYAIQRKNINLIKKFVKLVKKYGTKDNLNQLLFAATKTGNVEIINIFEG